MLGLYWFGKGGRRVVGGVVESVVEGMVEGIVVFYQVMLLDGLLFFNRMFGVGFVLKLMIVFCLRVLDFMSLWSLIFCFFRGLDRLMMIFIWWFLVWFLVVLLLIWGWVLVSFFMVKWVGLMFFMVNRVLVIVVVWVVDRF